MESTYHSVKRLFRSSHPLTGGRRKEGEGEVQFTYSQPNPLPSCYHRPPRHAFSSSLTRTDTPLTPHTPPTRVTTPVQTPVSGSLCVNRPEASISRSSSSSFWANCRLLPKSWAETMANSRPRFQPRFRIYRPT